MLRPSFLLGATAFASISSAALTLSFDPDQAFSLDPSGPNTLWIAGVLDNTSVSTSAQATSASLSSVAVTGLSTGATIDSGILGGFVKGKYVGSLFGLAIAPTTPLGLYNGKAKMQLKFGKSSPVTTALVDFSFTVTGQPQAVPEPGGFVALGIGVGAFVRRRRR